MKHEISQELVPQIKITLQYVFFRARLLFIIHKKQKRDSVLFVHEKLVFHSPLSKISCWTAIYYFIFHLSWYLFFSMRFFQEKNILPYGMFRY